MPGSDIVGKRQCHEGVYVALRNALRMMRGNSSIMKTRVDRERVIGRRDCRKSIEIASKIHSTRLCYPCIRLDGAWRMAYC